MLLSEFKRTKTNASTSKAAYITLSLPPTPNSNLPRPTEHRFANRVRLIITAAASAILRCHNWKRILSRPDCHAALTRHKDQVRSTHSSCRWRSTPVPAALSRALPPASLGQAPPFWRRERRRAAAHGAGRRVRRAASVRLLAASFAARAEAGQDRWREAGAPKKSSCPPLQRRWNHLNDMHKISD